ncbi:MAG TPA: right-handed parallel beta-helix repeat-containing protein [Phycisphaerales bacterium]|nr:right-handed parallel beta-helix repeat-containing protein [Phycisphaerales bacterium]
MRRNAFASFVTVILASLLTPLGMAQPQCDLDFNNDGVYPSDQDVSTFFSVFAGQACTTCDDVDINNDGSYPDQLDAILFMQRVANGSCNGESGGGRVTDNSTVEMTTEVAQGEPPTWIRWVAPWGNNSNPGTQDLPFATVQGALMRSNVTAHGIVYIMPGEYNMAIQWQYDSVYYGGESAERPLLIAAAPGSTTRPILNVPNTVSAGLRLINGTNFVHVRGLEFRARPQHTAVIAAIGNAHGLVVEDCVLVGGTNGVSLQGLDGQVVRDVLITKTIIKDQRNPDTHAQGAYVSASDNVVFEDCVFYNTGNRDTFCQGIYFVHGNYFRAARNCWFGDPGFAGIQARGGNFEITGNVFEDCGNAIGIGHPMAAPFGIWTSGTFSNNLIAQPKYPGWGIAVQRMNCANVFNNAFFSNSSDGQSIVRQDASPCANIYDNDVRGWGETFRNFGGVIGSGENIEIPISDHVVERPSVDWNHLLTRPPGVWNNTYDTQSYINYCRQLR